MARSGGSLPPAGRRARMRGSGPSGCARMRCSMTGGRSGRDDVVATLRMHMGGSAAAVAGLIAQVKRAGPHEVQVVLREGRPGLPFLLADPQLVMLPAHAPERAMAEGIGTGLYRMEPGRTAERAVLRRVEQHWKDGVAGWFDRVEVLRIAAPASAARGAEDGARRCGEHGRSGLGGGGAAAWADRADGGRGRCAGACGRRAGGRGGGRAPARWCGGCARSGHAADFA